MTAQRKTNSAPKRSEPNSSGRTEKATFGAGCFWHVEESFRLAQGVLSTQVGYMGGTMKDPSYEDVCTDQTGHIEVVQLEYNPKVISYQELLNIFWRIHDPTSKDRQGPDTGTQYRSVIFYHTEQQRMIAEEEKARLEKSGHYKKPIVTEIRPAQTFYRAEEYHQKYVMKRGRKTC